MLSLLSQKPQKRNISEGYAVEMHYLCNPIGTGRSVLSTYTSVIAP